MIVVLRRLILSAGHSYYYFSNVRGPCSAALVISNVVWLRFFVRRASLSMSALRMVWYGLNDILL